MIYNIIPTVSMTVMFALFKKNGAETETAYKYKINIYIFYPTKIKMAVNIAIN